VEMALASGGFGSDLSEEPAYQGLSRPRWNKRRREPVGESYRSRPARQAAHMCRYGRSVPVSRRPYEPTCVVYVVNVRVYSTSSAGRSTLLM
jgi:hypothetical protein